MTKRHLLLGLGAWLVVGTSWSPARAGDGPEARTFENVLGDDKIGTTRYSMTVQDDGSLLVKSESDVKVKVLFISFTFASKGYEIWKDGALQRFAANVNDNGDRRSLEATRQAAGLAVTVNGKGHTVSPKVWTSSFFLRPPPEVRGAVMPVLDTTTGKERSVRFRLVGREQCTAAGRSIPCEHFAVRGDDLEVEVWYDEAGRLVAREDVRMGKHPRMVLVKLGP